MIKFFLIILFSIVCSEPVPNQFWKHTAYKIQGSDKHYNGIDAFFNGDISDFHGKSVAIVANHTSINTSGENLVDLANRYLNLKVVFTPEHGLFGTKEAGEKVSGHMIGDVPVYSLYGKNKKPSKSQLDGIDVILFDMQDVGSRYYTYISTMTYVMDAAADYNIKMIVLDRPNPLGGIIWGPTLVDGFESFVGMHHVPVSHGLTIGEFALMIKGESWLESGNELNLEIKRVPFLDNSLIEFQVPPSPNIPDLETAMIYNGACLIEGTNLSEGRGTDMPFKVFGAPWLNSRVIIEMVDATDKEIYGAIISSTTFVPRSILGKSTHPKFLNQTCSGIKIEVVDYENFDALRLTISLLKAVNSFHSEDFKLLENNFIDKLYGSDALKKNINNDSSVHDLMLTWVHDAGNFVIRSAPYRLY